VSGPQGWSHIAERGSLLGLRLTVGCYRLFGRTLSLVLVHAIVLYYFLALPRARRASRAYLRRIAAWPEGAAALGRKPDTWASFLQFRAFALSIFDRIVLWLGREGDLAFETTGTDLCRQLLRPDRGGIVVGAHLGSFDALRVLARQDRLVVNALMYTRNAPRINAILRQLSPEARVRVLEVGGSPLDAVMQIRECIERGELVAILADRIEPGDRGRTCRVPLLGDPVEIPEAPYLLAGVLDCPLFFLVALRAGPGRYRVFAEVLAERVVLPRDEREKRIRELAAGYASRLERYCVMAPYQWFNFFDFWNEEGRAAAPDQRANL
jgi:predicted LPLAT superfamily acyltransferase